jgi:hypothetical protein
MQLYGVANHSVEQTVRLLGRAKIFAPEEIAILPLNKILEKKKPKFKCLIVLTHGDFKKNSKILLLPEFDETKVLFFSHAMRLNEYKGLTPLDFKPDPEYPGYGFTLEHELNVRALKKNQTTEVLRENGNYLDSIIAHVREGSLLNALMTFIYSLPSAHQARVKLLFAHWLYQGKAPKELEKAIAALPIETKVVTKILKKLEVLLFTDVGRAYQKAFKEFKASDKNMAKVDSIAKKNNVSPYEMKYLLSVIKDEKAAKTYSESFDKSRKHNINKNA